jgi:hypothetical protein
MAQPASRRLRQEVTMPLRWIAQRLNMGAAGFLANLLREARIKNNMRLSGTLDSARTLC